MIERSQVGEKVEIARWGAKQGWVSTRDEDEPQIELLQRNPDVSRPLPWRYGAAVCILITRLSDSGLYHAEVPRQPQAIRAAERIFLANLLWSEVVDLPKPNFPKVCLQVYRLEETQPRLSGLSGASSERGD